MAGIEGAILLSIAHGFESFLIKLKQTSAGSARIKERRLHAPRTGGGGGKGSERVNNLNIFIK
ncbi:hypothetical protein D9757_015487 [Collybiopsis confluens]|uniref:Uncharacterized protein n=1 Tax=Collybiopsis confluens TaxID=2823264 RepID=A0A8H5C9X7_9AGAR|nr:hypothetical protein D9757_015487 [Collybiopsis confluens]